MRFCALTVDRWPKVSERLTPRLGRRWGFCTPHDQWWRSQQSTLPPPMWTLLMNRSWRSKRCVTISGTGPQARLATWKSTQSGGFTLFANHLSERDAAPLQGVYELHMNCLKDRIRSPLEASLQWDEIGNEPVIKWSKVVTSFTLRTILQHNFQAKMNPFSRTLVSYLQISFRMNGIN